LIDDFTDISHVIENQFPAIYREEGDLMVQFVKAYYEFLQKNHYDTNRNILRDIDIDYTADEFIQYFKNTYLGDFPFISASDARFMVKHIVDYYRTKGTEESTKLLIRLLFNEEADVYYPSRDILKPSDSQWYRPEYIEVTRNPLTPSFIDKRVIGSRSGAKAMIEGLVTKRIDGRYIDVLYISDPQGIFLKGENISPSGSLRNTPTILGSMSRVRIMNGGRDNQIGDIIDVVGDFGKRGKVRVTETENATGRVNFDLIEGGSGYTLTSTTDVFISSAVLNLENPDMDFIRFENVTQKMEDLKLLAVGDILPDMEPGLFFVGVNENEVEVANGVILTMDSYEESGNPVVDVKLLVTAGTFDRQERIELVSSTDFLEGEVIEEESTTVISISDLVGTMTIGDRVEQVQSVSYDTMTADFTLDGPSDGFQIRETVVQYNANNEISATAQVINKAGNTLKVRNIRGYDDPGAFVTGEMIFGLDSSEDAEIQSIDLTDDTTLYTGFAFGYIDDTDGNNITLRPSWGIFEPGTAVRSFDPADLSGITVNGTASTQGVSIDEVGGRARLSTQPDSDTIVVENIFGSFEVGKSIRGSTTKKITEIDAIHNEGATDVWLNGVNTANGVIDLTANTTPIARVIAQNTSAIGIHGNTAPFFSSGQVNIEGSLTSISDITVNFNDVATFTTTTDHGYSPGDSLYIAVDMQQNAEVKYIHGIFESLSTPQTDTFTVQLNSEEAQIIRDGNFAFFFTSVKKTTLVPLTTIRSELISPPRDEFGDIIEINRNVDRISTGSGATFEIGTLENEETVFLATDIIGSNNVIGVPYLGIQIDAANSGIGFVDSIIVDAGGSGYSNNQVITFSGGGYAGGEPLVPAYGVIMTNGSGALIDIQMLSHGQEYWEEPDIIWPGGNSSADVEVVMDYGYGFPASPNGDIDNTLLDLWTLEPFTIGTISSLTGINPGVNYNQDPFVVVYNRYVAGFRRTDFSLTLSDQTGQFQVGETLVEEIPGDGGATLFARGYVLAVSGNQIIVRRTSFNTAFTSGHPIVGSVSGIQAMIVDVESIEGSHVMGDNAIVEGTVIAADGIAVTAEVVDSGFGYEDGEIVRLVQPNSPFVMAGIVDLGGQGIGTGYWKTTSSHLNSNPKLHDNRYYQEFSYDVITGKSLNKYENILKRILHVTGMAMFGTVEKRSKEKLKMKSSSAIEIMEI